MTFTVAGELDFVDVLLLQPYKKNAARATSVAEVQNNALRDLLRNMAEPPEIGTQQLGCGSPGQAQRVDTEQFSCLSSREIRILRKGMKTAQNQLAELAQDSRTRV